MLPDPESIRLANFDGLSSDGATLLDVRSPDAFALCHISGAKNACVYEVTFTQTVETTFPDKTNKIVVYGESDRFHAAPLAAARLKDAGYSEVSAFKGGLSEWIAKGGKVEKQERDSHSPAGSYKLDTEKSRVRWSGRNQSNQHDGEIACLSGSLEIDSEGNPTDGTLEVDMGQMSCSDIVDSKMAAMLIAHLESIDFFDTANNPTATFELARFFKDPDALPGSPNASIEGAITIRGKRRQLHLEATLAETEDGYVLQTQFDIDRTLFGAVYGSGRFFEKLGMHLVNDLVTVQVSGFFKRCSS